MKHEAEANNLRTREAENELAMYRNLCERQEREIKQRDTSTKSDTVRLTRQEEQILKLKTELHKSQEANSVSNIGKLGKKNHATSMILQNLRDEVRNLKDLHQKHSNLKDKQIEQLLDGFQKQMQLIDVLRRQKVGGFSNYSYF